MAAQVLPFPNTGGAAISPIACFLRIGEAPRKLADLHAAERLPARRVDGARVAGAGGDGALSTQEPGDEQPDSCLYNPLDPAPTRGGGLCCYPAVVPGGAFDQRAIEARPDVLVYATEPLREDLEVTGPITLTLYASSSAPDTDFTAKLVDVRPDGYAHNIAEGVVRARFRDSLESPTLITPDQIYQYTIDMWSTSHVFKAGHRLRLDVCSSNFPRYDRNQNTGHELGATSEIRHANQRVFHDERYPSHLILPVIPR